MVISPFSSMHLGMVFLVVFNVYRLLQIQELEKLIMFLGLFA